MSFSYHPDFLAGHYRAVADHPPGPRAPDGHVVSLVGALSFLGRMDEVEAAFARLVARRNVSSAAVTAARFFLGIGFTRLSKYSRARRLFRQNAESAGDSPAERFYVLQGRVFYCYYTGRFRKALKLAARARRLALAIDDPFALTLATDAYGHCRVVAGNVHLGLRMLEEARDLAAANLRNESAANSIAVSVELHRSELGLDLETGLSRLESRYQAVGTEDTYSAANVGLELARRYTLHGRFQDASATLEAVAPLIYRHQNRRQEITLNLRLAELAYQRGDIFGARHLLRFLDRLIHREADSTFALAALGLGRKLALASSCADEAARLEERARQLAGDFGTMRDDNLQVRLGWLPPERENREDRVHCVLQGARLLASPGEKLRPLLANGLLAEAATTAGLLPGATGLAVLPQNLGLLARDTAGIGWQEQALSSLQGKILRLLAAGGGDKAALVETVWGYRYDSLRHDAMVYSALSALRKALGPTAGRWLQATETGYAFGARVHWMSGEVALRETGEKTAPGIAHLPGLNHRQLEILAWLRENDSPRFLAVGDCCARFDVSEITALRDLDGLRRSGLVVRTGKARATRYSLNGAPTP